MPQVPQSTYCDYNITAGLGRAHSRVDHATQSLVLQPVILRVLCSTFVLALRQCNTLSCPMQKTQGVKNLRICPQNPRSGCNGPTTALTSPTFKTTYRGSRGQSPQPSKQEQPDFLRAALKPFLHGRGAEDAMRLGLSPSKRSHAGSSGYWQFCMARMNMSGCMTPLNKGLGG